MLEKEFLIKEGVCALSQYKYKDGLRDGIPIGLGYLSVSFGFGIAVVNSGLSVLTAVIISLTNLTSAGQFAGLTLITAGAALLEMALTEFVINLRYSLMSLSLSQKIDKSFTTIHRLITSFGITDEVFAVASSKKGTIGKSYMYGLITLPIIGWSLGTLLGAAAGELLPESVKVALGLAIYGMFVAIIVPPAKKDSGVLIAVLIAASISCCIYYLPIFQRITSGFSIIICAIVASAVAALIKPVDMEADE